MPYLGVLDVLAVFGYRVDSRAKMVRHQDKKYPAQDLLRRGWLEAYQSFQIRPVYDGAEHLLSFVGAEGTKARLFGVFRIIDRRAGEEGALPPGCPHEEWRTQPHFYALERQPGFENLEGRVVIEWGGAVRTWIQKASNKEVVQLLPPGQRVNLFKDYLGFTLTHLELRDVFNHADANSEWRARLSAVAGVYLILDTVTGRQYVGSAYGTEGFWGRWGAYARNGHGGNEQLRELVTTGDARSPYPDAFTYSILQILPRTTTRAEVVQWEAHYKQKLGSSATGLNSN